MQKEISKQVREHSLRVPPLRQVPASLVENLYSQSKAARWGLTLERFVLSLERSVTKRFAAESPPRQKVEDYLASLRLEDLAVACACAAGCEPAWEYFFATYRQYL